MEELKIHCKIILEFWLTPKNTRGFDQLCLVFLVKELINFALETMSGKKAHLADIVGSASDLHRQNLSMYTRR